MVSVIIGSRLITDIEGDGSHWQFGMGGVTAGEFTCDGLVNIGVASVSTWRPGLHAICGRRVNVAKSGM